MAGPNVNTHPNDDDRDDPPRSKTDFSKLPSGTVLSFNYDGGQQKGSRQVVIFQRLGTPFEGMTVGGKYEVRGLEEYFIAKPCDDPRLRKNLEEMLQRFKNDALNVEDSPRLLEMTLTRRERMLCHHIAAELGLTSQSHGIEPHRKIAIGCPATVTVASPIASAAAAAAAPTARTPKPKPYVYAVRKATDVEVISQPEATPAPEPAPPTYSVWDGEALRMIDEYNMRQLEEMPAWTHRKVNGTNHRFAIPPYMMLRNKDDANAANTGAGELKDAVWVPFEWAVAKGKGNSVLHVLARLMDPAHPTCIRNKAGKLFVLTAVQYYAPDCKECT